MVKQGFDPTDETLTKFVEFCERCEFTEQKAPKESKNKKPTWPPLSEADKKFKEEHKAKCRKFTPDKKATAANKTSTAPFMTLMDMICLNIRL